MSAALYDLEDMTRELRQASSSIDLDPASLEITDQRRDMISKLKRKYGGSLETLFQTYEDMQQQMILTVEGEKEIEICEKEIKTFVRDIGVKAKKLSLLRKKAGEDLSRLAGNELNSLEMGKAKFEVSFSHQPAKDEEDIGTLDGEKIGPDGMDKVVFLLSPNPGEPLKPLARIASGGELSRIVLALKAVLSKAKSLETLIFDEVDAGIGGATSEKVGLKLKQLSLNHQVICITTLPRLQNIQPTSSGFIKKSQTAAFRHCPAGAGSRQDRRNCTNDRRHYHHTRNPLPCKELLNRLY
jgi:DNA repair protein RecN (Recombination protein N)